MPTRFVQDLMSDEAYAAGKDQLLPATSKSAFVEGLRSLNTANGELLKQLLHLQSGGMHHSTAVEGTAQKLWLLCWPCGTHQLCRASACGLHNMEMVSIRTHMM